MNWKEIAFIFAFLFVWIVLNRWILPACGISTCMSGSCGLNRTAAPTSCCDPSAVKSPEESPTKKTPQSQSELDVPQGVNASEK